MYRILVCLAFFLSFFSLSFAQEAMRLPVDQTALVIRTDKGDAHFDVEIARTDEQRMRGLMYRQDFPANRAMLFTFDQVQEQIVSMWMVNTPLPLDMVFLDSSGHIVSIFTNARPYSPAIISSVYPAAFIIELNAGRAEAEGLAIGQKVLHPAICGKCGE